MAGGNKALDIGASGLDIGTKKLEVSGHNIVNLGSVAFKGSTMFQTDAFSETLQQSAANPGGAGGTGSNTAAAQIGNGTTIGAIFRDYTQGPLMTSSDSAHLAIEGKGWFQVLNSINGTKFATRDGTFRSDNNGYLVTKQGFRLQGMVVPGVDWPTYTVAEVGGELVYTKDTPPAPSAKTMGSLKVVYNLTIGSGLTVSGTPSQTNAQMEASAPRVQNYNINDKGEVEIQLSNGDSFTAGQVLLMGFSDEQGLQAVSSGLYTNFAAAGQLTYSIDKSQPGMGERGVVRQRKLEGSNVDLTSQFTEIIGTQKFIQGAARVITTADRALEEVVNLKR